MKITRTSANHAGAISGMSREVASVAESARTYSDELNDVDIAMLISFFKLLDSWDREVKRNAKSVQ
jgi:hypothetical protein